MFVKGVEMLKTGEWIQVYAFLDPVADEVLISFNGPSAGVVHYLSSGIAALHEVEDQKLSGFMIEGALKECNDEGIEIELDSDPSSPHSD
ncbi:MAG: hypothetical protein ACHQVK_01780 [Candidatus Paceibacterales bacterium]